MGNPDLLNLVKAINYSDLQSKDFDQSLLKAPILIIKNFFSADYIVENLSVIKKSFSAENDCYNTGELRVGMQNFQRFDIGNFPSKNPKCFRMFSLFMWSECSILKDGINRMIDFRDDHFAFSKNHDEKEGQYVFQDYPRIIQYPSGAGFLNEHIDEDKRLYPAGMPNMLVCLTRRESSAREGDFKRGGLYYTQEGVELDMEDLLDVGDLCMHNQEVSHGVKTIDSGEKPKLDIFSGRMMLLLSVYKFRKEL
jgi:hypothetical protein